MICNLDIAARVKMNGWHPIPGDKKYHYPWEAITAENYSFNIFQGMPVNVNYGVLTGNVTAVADFDIHNDEPNGMTVFRKLMAVMPEIFNGTIIERSPSGGRHVYFSGVHGKTYTVKIDGVEIEILCGRKLCFCWPSVRDDGPYEILTDRNFLNTRPEQLPSLPDIFSRPIEKRQSPTRHMHESGELFVSDSDAIVDGLVEAYLRGATQGLRHRKAVGLGRALAGFDVLTEMDVQRGVEMFFNNCGREAQRGEIDGIVKDAMHHPDTRPPTPWIRITEARRLRELSQKAVMAAKKLAGGATVG